MATELPPPIFLPSFMKGVHMQKALHKLLYLKPYSLYYRIPDRWIRLKRLAVRVSGGPF